MLAATAVAAGPSGEAARVNGRPIAAKDVQKLADQIAQGAGMSADQVWEDALQQLVALELMGQAAQKEGLTVSKAEVERELKELKAQFGDTSKFQESLAGATEAEFQAELQRSMIIEKLLDKHIKVTIAPEAVETFYKENQADFERPPMVRASHILVRIENDEAAARQRIEGILKRIKKGEDFAKLAVELSEDAPTAKRGGDLGFFPEHSTPVAEAAFKLKKGEISAPVKSPYGLHILKVTDTRPAGVAPFVEVADEIRSLLEEEEREEQEEAFIQRLRSDAKIEILLPQRPTTVADQQSRPPLSAQ
jgi:parvulin-like peptidyl-prolyl isomerase